MVENLMESDHQRVLVTAKDESFNQVIDAELTKLFPRRTIEKILIIVPPDGDRSMFDFSTGKRGRYWNYPAYGAGVIASYLRKDNIEVNILNLNNEILKACSLAKDEKDFDFNHAWIVRLSKEIETFKPDFIGVTCMFTQTHVSAVQVCNEIRNLTPETPISLGGVHITNSFVNWKQCQSILEDFKNVDLFFLYEGELAFRHFIRVVNKHEETNELFQVYFNSSQEKLYLTERKFPDTADLNIIPAFDLMDVDTLTTYGEIGSFLCLKENRGRCATVLSNRGCRGQCTFCSVRNFNGLGVRVKEVQTVIDELLLLKNKYKVDHIMWLDDDFLFNSKRALHLFNEMVRQEVNMTWDCTNGVIAASCTEELISAAAASGCIGVNIGMESGNPEILKVIKKPGTVKSFLKAAEVLKKYAQINARVFLMIGFPNESYRKILDTFNVAMEMDLDWYNVTILQPLPNTPIFDSMVQLGLVDNIKSEDVRYNSGAYGKKRKAMEKSQFTDALFDPFESVNLDDIPSKEELEPIWLYMNFNLNFKRLFKLTDPIKLKQQLRYLENITSKIAPDDPLPMYFCGYLQRKINGRVDDILYKRLESRLEESNYWENCFTHFNLKPSDLKK